MKVRLVKRADLSEQVKYSDKALKKGIKREMKQIVKEDYTKLFYEIEKCSIGVVKSKKGNNCLRVIYGEKEMFGDYAYSRIMRKFRKIKTFVQYIKSMTDKEYIDNHK